MLSGMFEAEWVQSKLTNDLPARHTMYYWPSDQHPGAAPGQCTHDVMSSSSEYHLEKKLRAEVMGSTRRIILGSKRKRVRESWENLQNTDRRRLPLLELLSEPQRFGDSEQWRMMLTRNWPVQLWPGVLLSLRVCVKLLPRSRSWPSSLLSLTSPLSLRLAPAVLAELTVGLVTLWPRQTDL